MPQLDWNNTTNDGMGDISAADNGWWQALLDQPLLGVADLSKQSGLIVRRVD